MGKLDLVGAGVNKEEQNFCRVTVRRQRFFISERESRLRENVRQRFRVLGAPS